MIISTRYGQWISLLTTLTRVYNLIRLMKLPIVVNKIIFIHFPDWINKEKEKVQEVSNFWQNFGRKYYLRNHIFEMIQTSLAKNIKKCEKKNGSGELSGQIINRNKTFRLNAEDSVKWALKIFCCQATRSAKNKI